MKLTVAQATIRFLANQFTERDGERQADIAQSHDADAHVAGESMYRLGRCPSPSSTQRPR